MSTKKMSKGRRKNKITTNFGWSSKKRPPKCKLPPGQVQSLIKDIQIDLCYKNQNVRGRQALKKGKSLILCTGRNISALFYATS